MRLRQIHRYCSWFTHSLVPRPHPAHYHFPRARYWKRYWKRSTLGLVLGLRLVYTDKVITIVHPDKSTSFSLHNKKWHHVLDLPHACSPTFLLHPVWFAETVFMLNDSLTLAKLDSKSIFSRVLSGTTRLLEGVGSSYSESSYSDSVNCCQLRWLVLFCFYCCFSCTARR